MKKVEMRFDHGCLKDFGGHVLILKIKSIVKNYNFNSSKKKL